MARFRAAKCGEPLYVKGTKVPFTFWPDNYLGFRPYCAASPWQCLLTVVASQKADGRATRCRAYIQQSYDFHVASRDAALGTKPLMLYYSYLNLVKAFLTFRASKLAPGTVRDRHGLSPGDRPLRYRGLTSVVFQVQRPDPRRYYDVFAELVRECGFTPLPSQKEYKLSDMMYQIPALHDAFVATKRKARVLFPVQLELRQDRAAKEVWLDGTLDVSSYGEDDRRRLKRFISGTAGIERVQGGTDRIRFESAPAHYTQSPQTVLRKHIVEQLRKHLWTEQTPTGFRYYLGCDKAFTAQVASNFAIMFTLGMIVRYTPELISKLEGEWLVHEYLATQPLQFAYLLGSGLARNEIIPAHLSSTQAA